MTAKANGTSDGEDIDFEGGLTLLSDRAFVSYEGDRVRSRPDHLRLRQVGASNRPAARRRRRRRGDVDRLPGSRRPSSRSATSSTTSTNEGSADVDGTEHDQGQRRPQRRRRDRRDHRTDRKPGLQLPARSRRPAAARRTRRGQGRSRPARVKKAHVDVYVGDDDIVRKARRRTDDRTEGHRRKGRSRIRPDARAASTRNRRSRRPADAEAARRPVPEARHQPARTARGRAAAAKASAACSKA